MKITDKDLLLADYMDGTISEADLLALYPELREDIEMINLSKNALSNLELESPTSKVDMPLEQYSKVFFRKQTWVAAALMILFITVALSLHKFYQNKSESIEFAEIFKNEKTDIKILALWSMWQENSISEQHRKQLLDVALNDKNSNVRYMALQKLSEQPLALSQPDLYQYIEREESLNNQTAWIELWVQIHNTKSDLLEQWLNQEKINPFIKEYGVGIINNI